MPRRRQHAPLRVLLNNRLVGHLTKAPGGAISFAYDQAWLDWAYALPISLSLPLREAPYRGAPVAAVFENPPLVGYLVGRAGFEPATSGLKVRCSTN